MIKCTAPILVVTLLLLLVSRRATGQDKSVNPGINKSFKNPDVSNFVERFEREGREIYDKRKEIVDACGVKPKMVVADVGAGTGLFTRLFSPAVGAEGKVYAVDISRKFIDHIEQSCRKEGIKNVVGVICGQDDAKLPPDSVDLVFICATYHHFEFPTRTMLSVRRALRADGQVILVDFRRVEGVSSKWILGHVRAGQETVTKEIVAAGFRQVEEKKLLKDNYFVRFAKAKPARVKRPRKDGLRPLPRSIRSPSENRATRQKINLGKQLFFDPRLSADNNMSCATCHVPEKAFGDGLARSKGKGGKLLARNTPTLLNVGLHDRYLWDGRAKSLEDQVLVPIQSADEMNQDLGKLETELSGVDSYVKQFRAVFKSRVTREGIARALAAYQRSLLSGPSPLDRYLEGEKTALSKSALRGLELFVGDAGCVRCHSGPLLSDNKFYRILASKADKGRGAVTGNSEDDYKFRTPMLRNIAKTGPYMHDGSMKTLNDVVTYDFRQVPSRGPDNLPLDVQPLVGQSFSDISDIVAFLESLTGKPLSSSSGR